MHINIKEGFQPPKHGLLMLQVLTLALFCVLMLRFWYLQMLMGDYYTHLAYKNHWRESLLYPNRGLILDDQGIILAENRPSYTVALVRSDCKDVPSTLAMISQWTGEPLSKLQRIYESATRNENRNKNVPSFRPIPMAHDVSFENLARIESQLVNWPGVTVLPQQRRFYRHGSAFAHVLGHMTIASQAALDADKDLVLGDSIGKQGLELVLEKRLRGSKGRLSRSVDSIGRTMAENILVSARGGEDIRLSLDNDLQSAVTSFMGDHAGCIIVMEPDTGKLRALVTAPSYDNNLFSGRLSEEDWLSLNNPETTPMYNRVIQSLYPPGSVWKLMMAGMFLKEGVDPKETVFCNGAFQLGNRTFRCWRAGGHGKVDMQQSLVESCDVYYYTMADRLGIDKVAEFAMASGFGKPTGIDLPEEKAGIVPNREWKRKLRGEGWHRGETINVSIGQGDTLVTPVQIAVYVSSLLNGGKLMKPLLLDDEQPLVMGHTPSSDSDRDFLAQAMRMTVEAPRGTAKRIIRNDAIMGGKTGTAQVVALGDTRLKADEMQYRHRDHAWIATYGIKDDRKYVVVVMIEHGGGGSSAAGPVARDIYSYLFDDNNAPENMARRNLAPSGYVAQNEPEDDAYMDEVIEASRRWERFLSPALESSGAMREENS